MLPVTSGVPQGSVLGPLLFLIYINDLAEVIPDDVSIRLFADDCVVFKKISTENDHASLQAAIVAIHNWCVNYGMALNSEKTVLLRVTRKKCPSVFTYHLNEDSIKEVDKYKYLGVTLTSNLSLGVHISEICVPAFQKLSFLKRKLNNATSTVWLLAYNACVRSKLNTRRQYGIRMLRKIY